MIYIETYLLFAGESYYPMRPSSQLRGCYTDIGEAVKFGKDLRRGDTIVDPDGCCYGEVGEVNYLSCDWFEVLNPDGSLVYAEGAAYGDDYGEFYINRIEGANEDE